MKICTTAYVSEYTGSRLMKGEAGEILLAHSTGVYLRFGGEVFLLCDRKWGVLPIGISVEHYEQIMSRLRLEAGQRALLEKNELLLPGAGFALERWNEAQKPAAENMPDSARILQAAEELAELGKTTGLSLLVLPLVLDRPADSALRSNPYFDRAYADFKALAEAMQAEETDRVAHYTQNLLGLGAGLTPSADDIFLGMLYVFRMLPCDGRDAVSVFRDTVSTFAAIRSNQISAAYLNAILQGAPFERMDRVYRGLCGEESLHIEELVRIGSNSGSEMLLGMLIALRICGYDVSKREELP